MGSSIAIEGLYAGYGAVRVIEDVSVSAAPAETVVLLGTNGNGKSTLIKCLMGMVPLEAGEIVLETEGTRIDLTRRSTEEIVGLGIALVPEGRRLFPKLTVEENLLLGAYRSEARAGIARRAGGRCKEFPIGVACEAGGDLARHRLPCAPGRAIVEDQLIGHVGGRAVPRTARHEADRGAIRDGDDDRRLARRGQLHDTASRHVGKVAEIECTRGAGAGRGDTAVEGQKRAGCRGAAQGQLAA